MNKLREFSAYMMYDISAGKAKAAPFIALAAFLTAAICVPYANAEGFNPTFGNLLFSCFKGSLPYEQGSGMPFIPPFMWVTLMFFCLTASLFYPYQSFRQNRYGVFSRCNSRSLWWSTKLLYVIFTTLICWIVVLLCVLIVSCVSLGKIDIALDSEYVALMLNRSVTENELKSIAVYVFWGPLLSLIMAAVIQLLIAFILNPPVGAILTLVQLVLSSFLQSGFLPGCYGMTVRYNEGQINFAFVYLAVCTVIAFLAGIMYVKNKDIL